MICKACTVGGFLNRNGYYDKATDLHYECEDKGCVCQHKVGPGLVVTKGSPVPLMQTQSP